MPLEWVAIRYAAQNHTVSESLALGITVLARTNVWPVTSGTEVAPGNRTVGKVTSLAR